MNRQIVRMQFGSHVYGTNVATSDRDYKSVFVPDGLDLVMQRPARHGSHNTKKDSSQRNTADDVDEESFSVQTYLRLLMEGQTVALDMLFTPPEWYTAVTDEWVALRERAKRSLLHSGTSAFVGYAKQQAAKYGLKGGRVEALRTTMSLLASLPDYHTLLDHEAEVRALVDGYKPPSDGKDKLVDWAMIRSPRGTMETHLQVCNRKIPMHATVKYAREVYGKILDQYGQRALAAERNEGVDWKAVMHAVRVSKEAIELLSTGSITLPRPEAQLLLRIRKGGMPIKEAESIIEAGLYELESIKDKSALPREPDREAADDMVRELHEGAITAYLRGRYAGL